MLLFRSRQHYDSWLVFGSHPDRKAILDVGNAHIPRSIFAESMGMKDGSFTIPNDVLELVSTPPEVISSRGFTESDLKKIQLEYLLYQSEADAGQCPFCRVHRDIHLMQVLSPHFVTYGIEKGGVSCPCIHLCFEDGFEVLGQADWIRNLKKAGNY